MKVGGLGGVFECESTCESMCETGVDYRKEIILSRLKHSDPRSSLTVLTRW